MKGISESVAGRRIIVCPPRKSSILKALRQFKGKTFRWVYLGENVSQFIVTERQIGDAGKRIEIGDKLQEIAGSLRQPYIDYIGKLSIANNSLEWWASCLSDKNPWFSKTFLYACYIRLCQSIIKSSKEENLVFIGENKAIREGITVNMKGLPHYEIRSFSTPVRDSADIFIDTVKSIAIKVNYISLIIIRMPIVGRYELKIPADSPSQDKRGLVLLYNWVDDRSFNDKGEYRDSYLGQLAYHIKNKGRKVVVVPHIVYMVEYLERLKKLKKSLGHFLLSESYLTIWDVFRIFCKTLFKFREKWVYPSLEGIKLDGIMTSDLHKYRERTDFTYNLLLYQAVKRLKGKGIPIESFIYPYESQTWEKVFCLALRKFYPSVKIIGYQHATAPKMLLNYFFSKEELPVLPFPDKVITTGKYTERQLKESGYDPAKVVRGGAIRFGNLLKKIADPLKRDISSPVILVTPSIDINESIELVRKMVKAFGELKHYQIILKFHPRRPYEVITEKDKSLKSLPEHFTVSEKPTDDLLQESSMLIYTSSATSIEAIAIGVPILHIKSDFTIDRDNLSDFTASIRESVSTPDEIIKATENILKMDEKELSRKRQLWVEVVADMFGPVDESTFDLFL
ncbi:MAG: hypothetical protein A2Z70_04180 [Chloroflexi bacterium RBG_13_48_17]|nr:MAG: hypothetical protein A2Z70_04180 [Chloroflexi bacterium RBG_13_48_17]